jgi:nucleoside-diphosphate-sugar epimerase
MTTAATAPNINNLVINIGSGNETSVRELVQMILHHTNSKAEVIYSPRSDPGVPRMCADLTLAATKLNYRPQTTLEKGLKLTLERDVRFLVR